ncbi:MAG: nucleoside triphosphate pyrophosphohydrolase [Bdellovibrionaceae bacterium]|nr:nucleoside triphosphate pyrophosphohydrolase [Pseudobdellovibrionaceae bacterium]
MPKPPDELRNLASLLKIAEDLMGPEGCPWDKAQTHQSLSSYAIEEACEVVEAIESSDDARLKDELGDLLYQVIIHCQIAKQRGSFNFMDVVENLSQKLIRRHPHVFGSAKAETIEQVKAEWEKIKKAEKRDKPTDPLALDVPTGLPALQRASKIGHRTNKLKFDWSNVNQVLAKVQEEHQELCEAMQTGNKEKIHHEIGDALFSLAQLARHLELDPEQILREANRRFERRFEAMIMLCRKRGWDWEKLNPEEKESLWREVKASN